MRPWGVVPAVLMLLLAVSSAGVLVGSPVASALGNGLFAVAPTTVTHHARQLYVPVLAAGGSSGDKVSVANLTKHSINLQLYAADAYNATNGGFAIEPNFEPKKHMGAWIHFAISKLTLPPLSGDIVPFTYEVPGNAHPGDYAGGIVAVQTTAAPTQRGNVKTRAEYAIGIPVLGRVLGPLHPGLAVTSVSITTKGTIATQFGGSVDATVTYSVTNVGSEYLKPAITVSLSPLIGGGPKYQQKLPAVLLPGSTVTFRHSFDNVFPFGALTATVSAKTHTAQATGSSTAIVIPWGIVAVVVLLIVLIVLLVRRRRRSPPGPLSELVEPHRAPPGPGAPTPPVPPAPVGSGPGARGP